MNREAPSFGLQDFSVGGVGPNGASDTQAGDHPAAVTTTLDYATKSDLEAGNPLRSVDARQEPKTEIVDLPLGFVGDPLAAGQCPESTLYDTGRGLFKPCPAASQVGVVAIESEGRIKLEGLYNVVTEPGYPALFGFEFLGTDVYLRPRVMPTPSGYALSVPARHPTHGGTTWKITGGHAVTFATARTGWRGGRSVPRRSLRTDRLLSHPPEGSAPNGLLGEPAIGWPREASPYYAASSDPGRERLQPAAISTRRSKSQPEEKQADTPSGYEVDLKVPQAPNLAPALATPPEGRCPDAARRRVGVPRAATGS